MKRIITFCLTLCMVLALAPPVLAVLDGAMGTAGLDPSSDPELMYPQDRTDPPTAFGIDVSKYQGSIDWDTVATQIDFAIIRCGYGDDMTSQDDPQWYTNADACTRLGIPFGVYIYSYAQTDEEARSEAYHVLRLIEGYEPTLPIYLDLEDEKYILPNCSNEDILRHTRIFCEIIEAAGYECGVYANWNWWTNYLTSSEYDQWDRWIARYASAPGYSKDYTIWQYTSSGTISGISGNVDLNHWYGTFPPKTHEHSYSSYVSQQPTCTADGVRTYSCSCGDSYTESISALGHSYGTSRTEPTCTASGLILYTCSACGSSYSETIPATGHSYTARVTAPTCTEQGYTTHTCTVCGSSHRDSYTAATGHSYENGTCTRCGAEDPDAVTVMSGDLNGDGTVTSADAVLLARYLVDLADLTEQQLLAADVDHDGSVSSADAVRLARFLAGVIDEI